MVPGARSSRGCDVTPVLSCTRWSTHCLPASWPSLEGKEVRTPFIQCLPFSARRYQLYLPFMPLAVEQLDLSGYDLVLFSSDAVVKGF